VETWLVYLNTFSCPKYINNQQIHFLILIMYFIYNVLAINIEVHLLIMIYVWLFL